jgi:hypothetical protein
VGLLIPHNITSTHKIWKKTKYNMSTPSKKRKTSSDEASFNTKLKDQSSLRFISSQVCQIVEAKQTTTYNEVANELVIEAMSLFHSKAEVTDKKKKDHEKNIRRRVYDALNVLLATDIISKTKEKGDKEKTIHWKGYPTGNSVDMSLLEREKGQLMREIERKKGFLVELLVQNVCFRNLEARNKRYQVADDAVPQPDLVTSNAHSVSNTSSAAALSNQTKSESRQDSKSKETPNQDATIGKEGVSNDMTLQQRDLSQKDDTMVIPESEKIDLPFIVVNTADNAVIQCEMNTDKTEVMFDFSQPFEINDDNEILKRLGLSRTSYHELKQMLPPNIFQYCEHNRLLDTVLLPPVGYHIPYPHGHGAPLPHPHAGGYPDHMPPVGSGSAISYPGHPAPVVSASHY